MYAFEHIPIKASLALALYLPSEETYDIQYLEVVSGISLELEAFEVGYTLWACSQHDICARSIHLIEALYPQSSAVLITRHHA